MRSIKIRYFAVGAVCAALMLIFAGIMLLALRGSLDDIASGIFRVITGRSTIRVFGRQLGGIETAGILLLAAAGYWLEKR